MVVPLIGYLDRFSARPGERIAVKVSSQRDEPYDADLVRVIHGDANPAGPGLKINEVEAGCAGRYPSRFQPVHSGSCGVVKIPAPIRLPDPCTIVVRVQPWLLDGRPQTVLSIEPGLALSVAAEGAILEAQGRRVQVSAPMLQRRWYELRVIASAGALRLRQTALQRSWGVADSGEAEMPGAAGSLRQIVFGARATVGPQPNDNPYSAFFNGRIEDTAVLNGVLASESPIDPSQAECLAWWDFSAEIPTDRIIDRGPRGLHGRLRNLPTRAVRGSSWTGDETNWRHMPRHYAAIHFHEDDLYDCGWDTDFTIDLPAGMRSGVYGVRLRCAGTEDIVPFYVLSPIGATT
ncbi:MAG TPA: N,N-dimethylformamidase beta subunit family domain-containing protein, partial [Stellaceae bacterium]